MRGRKTILILLLIMMAVAIGVGGIVLSSLYRASIRQQRQRLSELAETQAQTIDAVARFDAVYSTYEIPGGAFAATLLQIRNAHKNLEGIGKTGEFLLGKREGDHIVFLLPHRDPFPYPESVPLHTKESEPLRRALSGESGTMIHRGFRGKMVLAAYEPVPALQLGIEVKMDMSEIQEPFIRAGLTAISAGLLLILLGTLLFLRIGNPIVYRIEESERKYRSMFESAEDKMLLVTPDGIIIDANPAACHTYGYSRSEFMGRTVKEIVHPEQHPYVQNGLQEAAQGRSFRRESVHVRRNGSIFPVEIQLSPTVHRRKITVLAAIRDITARREAEEALRESETRYRNLSESLEKTVERKVAELQQAESLAAIGRMVSVVAHEIRNPLQNIAMGLDAMKRGVREDMRKSEILEEVEYGIGLLNNIVTELLDYSRPVRLHYSLIPVGEIISRSLKLSTSPPHNIDFILALEQAEKEVCVDVSRIMRAIVNLITNGIEAMPEGGELRIASRFHDQDGATFLTLTISDTGTGMDDKVKRHLFEPFFTTKSRGTGLGLSIVKKIVDAHKGTINIMSEPGKGTIVKVTLPEKKC